MRTATLLLSTLALALLLAGIGLAPSAHAQRLSAEEAERQGLDQPTVIRDQAPVAEGDTLEVCVDDVLLVADSGADGVAVHDPATGDLVNATFVVDPTNLSTPKNAIPNFDRDGIFVVDQIDDAVQEYDCEGNYVGLFAPAGGVNTAILDNAIGMDYSPDGTELWVTVTGGTNQDAVARFDTAGTYLGNIVANGSGGLDGPFDVLVRSSDMLVPAINGSDDVHQYDHAGTFLGIFQALTSALQFPEQANLAANGNVLVAGFSTPSGTYEYDGVTGAEVGYYSIVGGLRGVYELPNGNLLVTNSSGIHEITRANTLVRLIGEADQYIELFEAPDTGCSLLFNSAIMTPTTVAAGERVNFDVDVDNTGTEAKQVQLTLDYDRAGGPPMGTLTLISNVTVPPGGGAGSIRVRVPPAAPAGDYNLTLNLINQATGEICDTATFVLTVTAPRLPIPGTDVPFEVVSTDFFASATTSEAAAAVVSPNPFRGQTALRFEVTEAADVRLAVYDVLGREVAVLVDGRTEAGTHTATFDARGLAAGVYVYRLVVGTQVATGQLTLTH
jgi:hypothetical protein